MASKKFSEFVQALDFLDDWLVVGYDPDELVLEDANKRVTWAQATADLALDADLTAHVGNSGVHVTVSQSAALDAADTPSGANEYLTRSGGDAVYDSLGSAAAVQVNLDAHEIAASPHSGHLIDVIAGTNITIDKTDPQNPVISASGGGGGGHTIQDEGTPLTQRTNLNFVGAGVTATDDLGNDATVVTIPGGGGVPEAPEDGKNYARKDAGWVQTAEHEAGAGLTLFDYTARLPSGEPVAGELYLNSSDPALVTTITIHKTDFDGADQEALLELIESGDWINIHDAANPDVNRWRYDVQGSITDGGAYWIVPVQLFDNIGTITDGMRIQLWWRNRAATTRQPVQVITPGANPGTVNLEWNTSYLVNPASLSGSALTLQLPALANGRIVVFMANDTPNTHGLDVIINLFGGSEWGRFIFKDEWFEINSDGVVTVISYHFEPQTLFVNNTTQTGNIQIQGAWVNIPMDAVVNNKGFTRSGDEWVPRRSGRYGYTLTFQPVAPTVDCAFRASLVLSGAGGSSLAGVTSSNNTSATTQLGGMTSTGQYFNWDSDTMNGIIGQARAWPASGTVEINPTVQNFLQLRELF